VREAAGPFKRVRLRGPARAGYRPRLPEANDLGRLVKAIETNTWADLPDEHRTNIVFSAAAAALTQTAVTDTDGKFTLSGFGRERIVVLRLDGPIVERSSWGLISPERARRSANDRALARAAAASVHA